MSFRSAFEVGASPLHLNFARDLCAAVASCAAAAPSRSADVLGTIIERFQEKPLVFLLNDFYSDLLLCHSRKHEIWNAVPRNFFA